MSDEEGHPALLTHAITVYDMMWEQAEPYNLDPDYKVWTGYTTKLVTEEAELSVPYYTKVMQLLKEMDCVRQIRRGGSSTQSQWLLLQRPDLELYEPAAERLDLGTSRRKNDIEVLQQQVKDLNARVSNMETKLEEADL